MLDIFNDLAPFFHDCYAELGVREYARGQRISPPTASTRLKRLKEEGLLLERKERVYLLYRADRESKLFQELSRAYWRQEFERIGLIAFIEQEYLMPTIILFGSFSKAEVNPRSDIDIAIISPTKKKADFSRFEKATGRPIQLFNFRKLSEIPNEGLMKNIRKAYLLRGRLD